MKNAKIRLKYEPSDIIFDVVKNSVTAYENANKVFNSDTLCYTEEFNALFLSASNSVIGYANISNGGQTSTVVDVKPLMVSALLCGAVRMIITHNHPSGNKNPSAEDDKITLKIQKACELLEIGLLDHIIVTSSGYYSYADNGKL